MYERIGLIPQWEITVEQDAEWFADVGESPIVIVSPLEIWVTHVVVTKVLSI
jgi:hypothetical protein